MLRRLASEGKHLSPAEWYESSGRFANFLAVEFAEPGRSTEEFVAELKDALEQGKSFDPDKYAPPTSRVCHPRLVRVD